MVQQLSHLTLQVFPIDGDIIRKRYPQVRLGKKDAL